MLSKERQISMLPTRYIYAPTFQNCIRQYQTGYVTPTGARAGEPPPEAPPAPRPVGSAEVMEGATIRNHRAAA